MGADGKGNGGGKDGMNLEDFRLWREFTRDIDPLEDPEWEILEKLFQGKTPQSSETFQVSYEIRETIAPLKPEVTRPFEPPQLDGRTETKLRRGKMPIDGTLDLHGMRQEQAHAALEQFILGAHARDRRCLLLITGKGKSVRAADVHDHAPGVLRQKVPQWLSLPPLKEKILKIVPAVQRHGGTGAFYIYLKRRRINGDR